MSRPAPAPAPEKLSRARIVEAALAVLDRDGLARFSLREVARAVGVFPTALYWHVGGGRDGLLAAAVGAALADVTPPDAGEDWQAWFGALFRRYRAAVRRHPGVAPLLGGQLLSNAGIELSLVEAMLAQLARAGFAGEALRHAYNASVAAMIGFTTLELAAPPAPGSAPLAPLMAERLARVRPDHHPVLDRNLDALRNRAFILRWDGGLEAPLDASFERYVDAFLRGLDALPRG